MLKETAPSGRETTLQLRRIFSAPREKVFKAWTDPSEMKKWIIPEEGFTVPAVEVDLRVGGEFRIEMLSPKGSRHTAVGRYREIAALEKLVFTWSWLEYPVHGETLVTIEFRDLGGATERSFTHELFPTKASRDDHQRGWNGCLDQLTKYCAALGQ